MCRGGGVGYRVAWSRPTAPRPRARLPRHLVGVVVPVLAVAAVVLTWGRHPPAVVQMVVVALLAGSVLAAVHHAEVVAHRVGEPFGSLVLAVAVTIIEVSLIVTLMVADVATLARDTSSRPSSHRRSKGVEGRRTSPSLRPRRDRPSGPAAGDLAAVRTPSATGSRSPSTSRSAPIAGTGLMIPAAAVASIWLGGPVVPGSAPRISCS